MTDNEIIKALDFYSAVLPRCEERHLYRLALDLANRQKAEIERLEKIVDELRADHKALDDVFSNELVACHDCHLKYAEKINQHKAEAIKEFAERLKQKFGNLEYVIHTNRKTVSVEWAKAEVDAVLQTGCVIAIDNLVKEMVGEGE